jgi:hypothetical protein
MLILCFYVFTFLQFPIFQFPILQFPILQFPILQFPILQFPILAFWDFGILPFWDLGSWIRGPDPDPGVRDPGSGGPDPRSGVREGELPLSGGSILTLFTSYSVSYRNNLFAGTTNNVLLYVLAQSIFECIYDKT